MPGAQTSSTSQSWWKTLTLAIREHLPLFGLLGLTWVTYVSVSSVYPGPDLVVQGSDLSMIFAIGVAAVLAVCTAYSVSWMLRRLRSGVPNGGTWRQYLDQRVEPRQFVGVFVALPWWLLFVRVFDTLKAYIPVIIPFRWDELFMEVDRALHGGAHPWRLLHDLFGGPVATVAIDEFYYSWYLVVIVAIAWASWSADRKKRLRFFVALALVVFGLGNVAALFGSSAGPVFYDRVVAGIPPGGGPFRELVVHLEKVQASNSLHMWAIQEGIWDNYQALPDSGLGSISAMPSIHVAVVVLFALATRGTHTAVGALAWLYALLTLIGSVYLGWHYAIDGYVGALGTVLLWVWAGIFTNWYWGRFVAPLEDDGSELRGSTPGCRAS